MGQVVHVLPLIQNDNFALKGGTAINLFFRDLPRLSVDIDLTYLPIETREVSFKKIHGYLLDVMKTLKSRGFECTSHKPLDGKNETKLVACKNETQIKIEPNFTIRGGKLICANSSSKFLMMTNDGKFLDVPSKTIGKRIPSFSSWPEAKSDLNFCLI